MFWDVERAPYRPEKFETTDDPFMLSIHPELESGCVADESAGLSAIVKNKKKANSAVKTQSSLEPEEENFTLDDDFDAMLAENEKKKPAVPTVKAKAVSLDVVSLDNNVKKIIIPCGNGYDESLDVSEILSAHREIKALKEEVAKLKNSVASGVNPRARYMEGEDVLIKNMIEKSKTKSCKISLKIQMELPPKELYDTIKLAYPDGMTEQFVSSLTARISLDKLLESLNGGLARYYDGENTKKKSDQSDVQ